MRVANNVFSAAWSATGGSAKLYLDMKVLAALLFTGVLTCAGPTHAQAPIEFTNSPEAVRLYEESTLESLRNRCESVKASGLMSRPEVQALKNGFVSVHGFAKDPNRYAAYLYDQDKHSFVLLDGQRLGRGVRLTVPLALPRDYGRCRIVRDVEGFEQLELVHRDLTAQSDAQAFDRLLKEAVDWTGPGDAPCAQPLKTDGARTADRVVLQGKLATFPSCSEGGMSVRDRMDKLARRVFER